MQTWAGLFVRDSVFTYSPHFRGMQHPLSPGAPDTFPLVKEMGRGAQEFFPNVDRTEVTMLSVARGFGTLLGLFLTCCRPDHTVRCRTEPTQGYATLVSTVLCTTRTPSLRPALHKQQATFTKRSARGSQDQVITTHRCKHCGYLLAVLIFVLHVYQSTNMCTYTHPNPQTHCEERECLCVVRKPADFHHKHCSAMAHPKFGQTRLRVNLN